MKSGRNLSDKWRSTFKIGDTQLRSITEIAPKALFLDVNKSPIRHSFRVDAKFLW